jgi:hypothetical protein
MKEKTSIYLENEKSQVTEEEELIVNCKKVEIKLFSLEKHPDVLSQT